MGVGLNLFGHIFKLRRCVKYAKFPFGKEQTCRLFCRMKVERC